MKLKFAKHSWWFAHDPFVWYIIVSFVKIIVCDNFNENGDELSDIRSDNEGAKTCTRRYPEGDPATNNQGEC